MKHTKQTLRFWNFVSPPFPDNSATSWTTVQGRKARKIRIISSESVRNIPLNWGFDSVPFYTKRKVKTCITYIQETESFRNTLNTHILFYSDKIMNIIHRYIVTRKWIITCNWNEEGKQREFLITMIVMLDLFYDIMAAVCCYVYDSCLFVLLYCTWVQPCMFILMMRRK